MNTPEGEPQNTRQRIAENINFPVPEGFTENISLNQLVLAAGDSKRYRSTPLLEPGERTKLPEGEPRHWFFVLPSQHHIHGLAQVEFGMISGDYTGYDTTESRFDHELLIDHFIRMNLEQNEVVRKLYYLIGGFTVEAVRRTGDDFFAGLEVQYAKFSEDQAYKWVQLVYSRALLNTGTILRNQMRRNIKEYPSWMQKAILPKNKSRVAELMALSALAAARNT